MNTPPLSPLPLTEEGQRQAGLQRLRGSEFLKWLDAIQPTEAMRRGGPSKGWTGQAAKGGAPKTLP